MEESQADIKVSNNNPSNSSNPGNNGEEASNDMIDGVPVKDQRTTPIFKPENLYYDMSGEKFLIIFNHFVYEPSAYYSYKPPSPRKGTDKDVAALKQVFGSLGFKVLTFTDLKHEEILKKISTISNQDHSRTSCLAVAILTHGDTGGMLKASDRAYYLKDITAMFEHGHPTLVNKPKLFFIQACRGGRTDAGRRTQHDGTDDNTLVVPSHSDFLFLYSTVEDHLSWRDVGGSWLIQEFCEVLKTYSQSYDLLQLITIATRNVAYGRSSNTPRDKSTHNKKQTPETRFTLTKLLMF